MAATKCPNPGCPYLFDAAGLPPGVALACPQCGMRFTLGQNPTPPAPPPTASPQRRTADGGNRNIVLVVVVAAVLCGAAAAMYYGLKGSNTPPKNDTAIRHKELDFSLIPPPSPWFPDDDLKKKLKGGIVEAYRSANPDGWLAVGGKVFETRNPRPSELRDRFMSALAVMIDPQSIRETPLENVTLLGHPASGFQYRGQAADGTNVAGYACAASVNGVGYWLIFGTSESSLESMSKEVDKFRDGLKSLNGRTGWKAKEQTVVTYSGQDLPYKIIDANGLWKLSDTPVKSVDPKADLYLESNLKPKKGEHEQSAELIVYILDKKSPNPLDDARQYIEARRAAEVKAGGGTFKVTNVERTGDPDGEPVVNSVDTPTPVLRLESKVVNASNQWRLIVISAVESGDKVIALEARCVWDDHATFEPRMMQIAGTLQAN